MKVSVVEPQGILIGPYRIWNDYLLDSLCEIGFEEVWK